MFPFKKKNPAELKKETLHEQVRRRFDETDTRLDEAVKKMHECLAKRALVPVKVK